MLAPRYVYDLARDERLDPDSAVVATAIAWSESGLNPDRVGDESLADDTWGPSIGLWQVRSLHAHRGAGRTRDADRLKEPAFNAAAMAEISETGADFTPWSDYRNGRYERYLDDVREAVSMQTWHPRAIRAAADPNHAGLSILDVPPKIVLHTTEIGGLYRYSPASYFGNPYWPHATIDAAGIHQHIAIDAGAYALYRGGVATNTANVVQCEIMAYAALIEDLDDDTLGHVADWVAWVAEQTGAPLDVCPQGFHGLGEGMVLASENSPIRFGDDDWLRFSGICGHQHVPSGNDHWDPGRFPVDRLFALLGRSQQGGFFMALTDQQQAELYAWTRDLQQYMSQEKGGGVDTIEEAIAGVVNDVKALTTILDQAVLGFFADFDPVAGRRDIDAGRDELVRRIKSLATG